MARDLMDVLYGPPVRRLEPVECPHCGLSTIWHGMPELRAHFRVCQILAIAEAAKGYQPVDDLL